jgi:hypothetical protein
MGLASALDFEITVGRRRTSSSNTSLPNHKRSRWVTTSHSIAPETRAGLLPPIAEPARRYENIVVHKCTIGGVTECRDDSGTPPSKRKAGG